MYHCTIVAFKSVTARNVTCRNTSCTANEHRDVGNTVARLLSTTTTTTMTTKTSGRPSSSSFYFWKSPVGLDHHTVVGLVIQSRTTARAIYGRVATRGHFAEFHYVIERHWATPFGITLFSRASVCFFFLRKRHFPPLLRPYIVALSIRVSNAINFIDY